MKNFSDLYVQMLKETCKGFKKTVIDNKNVIITIGVLATVIIILLATIKYWLPPLLIVAGVVYVFTNISGKTTPIATEPPIQAVYAQMVTVLNKLRQHLHLSSISEERDIAVNMPLTNLEGLTVIRCRALKASITALTAEELNIAIPLVQNTLYQQNLPIYVRDITDTGMYLLFNLVYADTPELQQYCESNIVRNQSYTANVNLYEEL